MHNKKKISSFFLLKVFKLFSTYKNHLQRQLIILNYLLIIYKLLKDFSKLTLLFHKSFFNNKILLVFCLSILGTFISYNSIRRILL